MPGANKLALMNQINDEETNRIKEMKLRESNLIKTVNHLTRQIDNFKVQLKEQRT